MTVLILQWIMSTMSGLETYIMREILGYIDGEYNDREHALKYVFIMIAFWIITKVIETNISFIQIKNSNRSNVSMMGLVYSKIYNLSGSNKQYGKGAINNLIDSDTDKIQDFV